MTQPAKVQEPSMEEILASIRRIIADDEAKPPAAEKAAAPSPVPVKAAPPPVPAPVAAKPAVKEAPPSKIVTPAMPAARLAPQPVAARPTPPAPPPPAAAASNSQDDIDALLAGLGESTSAAEVRPAQTEPEESDVLDLTDEMVAAPLPTAIANSAPPPSAAPASFRKVEPQDDIEFIEAATASRAASKAAAAVAAAFDPPLSEPAVPKQAMLSQSTVSSVESAFNALANTVLSNNARTLEDLVREMLRPMLKGWLDDNLPGLVERIVKAEIERVSRGR